MVGRVVHVNNARPPLPGLKATGTPHFGRLTITIDTFNDEFNGGVTGTGVADKDAGQGLQNPIICEEFYRVA